MLFGEPVYDGVSYFDALETGFSHAKAIRPIPPSALLWGGAGACSVVCLWVGWDRKARQSWVACEGCPRASPRAGYSGLPIGVQGL